MADRVPDPTLQQSGVPMPGVANTASRQARNASFPIYWMETGIIVVSARRTLGRILQLAVRDRAQWIVVRYVAEGHARPLLYVHRVDEIRILASDPEQSARPAADALALWQVIPSTEIRGQERPTGVSVTEGVGFAGQRLVHLDPDDWPLAVGDVSRGPAHSRELGAMRASPGSDAKAPADHASMQRKLEISAQAPAEIRVGTIGTIDIQLALSGVAEPLRNRIVGTVCARDETDVMAILCVRGPALTSVGPTHRPIVTPSQQRPLCRSTFELRATSEGTTDITIVFRQGGTELGTIALRIRSVASRASGYCAMSKVAAVPRNTADDGIALLLVEEKWQPGGGLCYSYKLVCESLEWDFLEFHSAPLLDRAGGGAASTRQYVESLYERVTRRALEKQSDCRAFSRELVALGRDLAQQLLPPELMRLLWESREQLRALHIKSWEPYVPWELVCLHDPGRQSDPIFLAECNLTRSLQGKSRPAQLDLGEWCYLSAQYSHGSQEPLIGDGAMLNEVLNAHNITPRSIRADPNEVYDVLNASNFDVLHISCHGAAAAQAGNSVLIIGDRKCGDRTEDLMIDPTTVRAEAHFSERHPLVFLNACESARLGPSLTALNGWPRTFWDAGASAFIGTSWSVRDMPARVFSKAFYTALLDGKTLADAAGAARGSAKNLGDASWLAYKVYGRPTARAVDQTYSLGSVGG